MNKSKLKSYAPSARRDFICAVTERANLLGLSKNKIEPVEEKGDVAIIAGRAWPRKVAEQRKGLDQRIELEGFGQVMEAVAYTWFNRFLALRYMELHDYLGHGFRVLSHPGGSHIPEILEQAAKVDLPGLDKDKVVELKLDGNKDAELYRMLLIAQCNALHKAMPFLFERIDDETELLLPENLLHSDSLLRRLVTEIDEEDWKEVEIIGWLYQFYISEKKDQVIGKVVKSEDIPAATQLFTPNWIVKYMVQNSLGRKWLMTYPDSKIKEKMEYYIEPAEQTEEVNRQLKKITPESLNPEEITVMDPASGSGHILVEAYDLFKEIYLERGYRTRDIPRLILGKNLYGLDIDDRAAQMAGFALLMKARADDRQILSGDDQPKINVMAIQESKGGDADDIADNLLKGSSEVSRQIIKELLELFDYGKTFGSLITIPENITNQLNIISELLENNMNLSNLFAKMASAILLPIIKQAKLLSAQYDCVITNPPYMGGGGMNGCLKAYAKNNYPYSKSDLFAMFIERNLALTLKKGMVAMITMQSWMFLSSFEKLRINMLNQNTILSMAHFGARAFDSIGGEVVSTTAFVLENNHCPQYKGGYLRLVNGNSESEKEAAIFDAILSPDCSWLYNASADDFRKIPGGPIAYWVSEKIRDIFKEEPSIGASVEAKQGLGTGKDASFFRFFWEVNKNYMGLGFSNAQEGWDNNKKWFPLNKGGSFRKWYGNREYLIAFDKENRDILKELGNHLPSEHKYFSPFISWSDITSAINSFRIFDQGFLFSNTGHCAFPTNSNQEAVLLSYCNNKFVNMMTKILNPTIHFHVGYFNLLPYPTRLEKKVTDVTRIANLSVSIAKADWSAYERSWDFQSLPLLKAFSDATPTLESSYTAWITQNRDSIAEMKHLEEENNRLFIDAYGLADELTAAVPLSQITLTVNPAYRYGGKLTEEEQWTRFREDTIQELVSYSIGCMMGRYSLDELGLIYAHSGNEGFDQSKYKSFPADDDGIVPIMDMEWFDDDAAVRFENFISVAWSRETLEENLKFIAESLSAKKGEAPRDTIRRYFSSSFFENHLKIYKKRPIYWLFSSGKLKAFECLVYLHRYNESTLSRMRNEYVTPLQGKFSARADYLQNEIDSSTSASERNKLQKQLDILKKKQAELKSFDDELRHYADQRIKLDLDDGVKVNYSKFGNLLAEVNAITGKKKT